MADYWANVQPSLTSPLTSSEKADFSGADHVFSVVTRRISFSAGAAAATIKMRLAGDDGSDGRPAHDLEITVPANSTILRDFRVSHIRNQGTTAGATVVGFW